MRGRTSRALLVSLSVVLQAGCFLGLYWLRVDHNIVHPGRHETLALLFNNDAILFGTGAVMSLLLCAPIMAGRREGGDRLARLRHAWVGAIQLTLACAVIALPVALFLALNLWGS
jgi:hypothetical protein